MANHVFLPVSGGRQGNSPLNDSRQSQWPLLKCRFYFGFKDSIQPFCPHRNGICFSTWTEHSETFES